MLDRLAARSCRRSTRWGTGPLALLALLAAPGAAAAAGGFDRDALGEFLAQTAQRATAHGEGHWSAEYRGYKILVFAHEGHDRMRIISPVAAASDLGEPELRRLLGANFERALDAKYCLSEGVVWTIFNHRLSTLSEEELLSALDQVVTLRRTYGTTYTSTELTFGREPG